MPNPGIETRVNLQLKKNSPNATDNKKKVRTMKLPLSGENSNGSGTLSGAGSEQDLGNSNTKGVTTEIRKNLIKKNESSLTSKIIGTGSVRKITKTPKKKTKSKATMSNSGMQDEIDAAGNPEMKAQLKTTKKTSNVKKVLQQKNSPKSEDKMEGSPPGKVIEANVSTNIGNDVTNTNKSTLKLKSKKKSTAEPSSETKAKKLRGTKSFKLTAKEFGANNNSWPNENPPDKSLNAFPPPNVENVKADAQAYRTRIDLAGFSNDNISLDLNGRRLVVIAYRLAGKSSNARKVTEVVDIPTNVEVDTLHISRRSDGSLVIEEVIPSTQ